MTSPSAPQNRPGALHAHRSTRGAATAARARRGRVLALATMLAVFALFGSIVWYAWVESRALGDGEVPVLRASKEPWRVSPLDPGGLPLPHADRPIGRVLDGDEEAVAEPERILPVEEPDLRSVAAKVAEAPVRVAQNDPTPGAPRSLLHPPAEAAPITDIGDGESSADVAPTLTDPSSDEGTAALAPEPAAGEEAALEPQATAVDGSQPAAPIIPSSPTSAAPAAPTAAPQPATPPASADAQERATRLEPPAMPSSSQAAPKAEAVKQATGAPGQAKTVSAAPAAGFRIQLAAVSRREGIEQQWAAMQRRWPEALSGRQMAIEPMERNGRTLWRIQAVGFQSATEAAAACRMIRERGGDCFVVGK